MRNLPSSNGGFQFLLGMAGFVGTLLVLAIIAGLIIYLVKRSKPTTNLPGQPRMPVGMPPAMQILDERLAKGEIEIEDYLNRKTAMLGEAPKPNEWQPAPTASAAQPSEGEPTA